MDQGQQKKEYVIKKKDRKYDTFITKQDYENLQIEIKSQYQSLENFIEEWEAQFQEKYPSVIQLNNSNEQFKEMLQQQNQLFSQLVEFFNKFKEAINSFKKNDCLISYYDFIQNIRSSQSLKYEKQGQELIKNLNIAYQARETTKNLNEKWFDEQNLLNQNGSDQKIDRILQSLKFRNDITSNIRRHIITYLQNTPDNVKYSQIRTILVEDEQFRGNIDQNNQKIGLGFYKQTDDVAYFGCFNEDEFIWGCQVQAISNISYIIYQGYFAKGLINFEGQMIGRDHQQKFSLYKGQFKSGQRSGYGIYAWYDEENKLHNDQNFDKCQGKYDGEWKFDQFNGAGILSFSSDKKVIKGQFSNGQLVEDEQNTQITIENETLSLGEYKKKQNQIKQQQQKMEINKTIFPAQFEQGNQFHIAQNQQQQVTNNFQQTPSQFNKNQQFVTQFNPPNKIFPQNFIPNLNQNNNNPVLNTQQSYQKSNFLNSNPQQLKQIPTQQNTQEQNTKNKTQQNFQNQIKQDPQNNNTGGYRQTYVSVPIQKNTNTVNNFQNQQSMQGDQQQFNPNFIEKKFQNNAIQENEKK